MLRYKASDIIKRAKDIADLRGTNFISDEECLSLLNESWTNIYSKLINLNDKAFLNKTEIFRGDNALPEDFYQLGFVADPFNQPIERYTVGALSRWYEMVNGNIQLNGADRAYMYYYTVPVTLTFPKPHVHSNIQTTGEGYFPDTPLFYCRPWGMMVAANGAYSLKSSKFKDWFIDSTKGILSQNSVDTQIYNVLVDYDGNQIVYPVAKKTAGPNPLTTSSYLRLDGETIKVMYRNSNVDKNGEKIYSKVYYHRGDNDWAVLNLENREYFEFKSEDNTIPLIPDGIKDIEDFEEVIDGHTYTETYDGYYLDGSILMKKSGGSDFRYRTGVVFSVDYDTGYGAILGNVRDIYSIFPDTELNFPDNLYYNILSYQLALAFACKQSKDTQWIERQLASNWETFYDTLNRDCFGQSHVINTYRGTYV